MARKKIVAKGDVFCFPLEGNAYSVGLATHTGKSAFVFLGYFFKFRILRKPSLEDCQSILTGENVLSVHLLSTLGFTIGQWEIIGNIAPIEPEVWPIPLMLNSDFKPNPIYEVLDPVTLQWRETLPYVESMKPEIVGEAGTAGYQYIEGRISRMLEVENR